MEEDPFRLPESKPKVSEVTGALSRTSSSGRVVADECSVLKARY